MRMIPALLFLLTACSGGRDEPIATGIFAGQGRDRLCVQKAGDVVSAGLITYAATGDTNCTIAGQLQPVGDAFVLTSRADETCRLSLTLNGPSLRIAKVIGNCDYYCGPRANLAGRSFTRAPSAPAPTDFGGTKLC